MVRMQKIEVASQLSKIHFSSKKGSLIRKKDNGINENIKMPN